MQLRPKRGQLCYIQKYNALPQESGRLAVVVSSDRFNDNMENLIVCYLSRNRFRSSGPSIPVQNRAGKVSYVIPHPVTVSSDRVAAVGTLVSEEEQEVINAALCQVLAL